MIETTEKQVTVSVMVLKCQKCGVKVEWPNVDGWLMANSYQTTCADQVASRLRMPIHVVSALIDAGQLEDIREPHFHENDAVHFCGACKQMLGRFITGAATPIGTGAKLGMVPAPTQPPAKG